MRVATVVAVAAVAALLAGCNTPRHPAPSNTTIVDTPPPEHVPVVIVGAGLAGLVASYELSKRGIEAHVLEAEAIVGGRVKTPSYGPGLAAEAGLQELWGDNPLVGIAKELDVALDGEAEPPLSSVVIDGQLYPFLADTSDEYLATFLAPDELRALRAWMNDTQALRQRALDRGLADPGVAALQGLSLKTWVERAHLAPRATAFLRLTIECELATGWDQVSALIGLLEYGVFLGEGEPALHVRGGNMRLVEALARRAHISLATPVTRVRKGDRGLEVHALRDGRDVVILADQVILAVPAWRVHMIELDPPLPEDVWQAILTLGRGSYTVVHLRVDKAARALWGGDDAAPFPVLTDGVLGVIYGVTEPSPPEAPDEIFSLLVHGAAASGWHMAPRDRKLAEVRAALDALWPGLGAHVRSAGVYGYHPASVATWPPGRSPLDARHLALREPHGGVWLVGDWTRNAHSDGAARSAIDAATRIAAGAPTR